MIAENVTGATEVTMSEEIEKLKRAIQNRRQTRGWCGRMQAAKYIKMSASWLHKHRATGKAPPCIEIDGRSWYRKHDLDRYLETKGLTPRQRKAKRRTAAVRVAKLSDVAKEEVLSEARPPKTVARNYPLHQEAQAFFGSLSPFQHSLLLSLLGREF